MINLIAMELRQKWLLCAAMVMLVVFVGILLRVTPFTVETPSPFLSYIYLFCSLVMGATFFCREEKGGPDWCIYYHPISRAQIWLVKYGVGLGCSILLGVIACFVLSIIPGAGGMKTVLEEMRNLMVSHLSAVFAVFTITAFISAFFASEFATITISAIYYVVLTFLLNFGITSVYFSWDEADEGSLVLLVVCGSYLLGVPFFIAGIVMYKRRRFLDMGWARRALFVAALFTITSLVGGFIVFVDIADLLYIIFG